jgi:hypothetical protein
MTDEENIRKIAERFRVPSRVADQVQHGVEKTRGGYILYETRPQWDNADGQWMKSVIAKMVWNRATESWTLYWMPSSMKWLKYGEYKNFGKVLNVIAQDKDACFWG